MDFEECVHVSDNGSKRRMTFATSSVPEIGITKEVDRTPTIKFYSMISGRESPQTEDKKRPHTNRGKSHQFTVCNSQQINGNQRQMDQQYNLRYR